MAAVADVKSLQCPTLCDPIDGSLPGSPTPGILQARTLGVGCHFLLQCMKVKNESEVAQSCPTLHDPMDCSLPDSSIHGISQARVLEWVAIVFTGANGWVKIISTLILPATILDPLLYGLLGSVIQRGEVLGKYLKYVL